VRLLITVSLVVLFLAGCLRHTPIKPSELPKLNGPSVGTVVGGRAPGTVVAVATRTVEKPNGQLVEIRGEFELVVTTRNGKLTFGKPVMSEITDGRLTVRSGNRSPWSAPIDSVQSAQVQQPNRRANMFWGSVGMVLAFGAVLLVTAN